MGLSAWMACLSTQPVGSEVPAAWAPSGCGNCYLALTKLDHHSAALTLTGPAPCDPPANGRSKGSGECKAASTAKPQREQVVHSWYPGAPLSCLLPSHSLHATRGMQAPKPWRDRIRRKMMKKRKGKKDLEGKEQPGERPEGPRGGGGQEGQCRGKRHRERTI